MNGLRRCDINRAESRWQSRRTQSSHVLTTRAPTRCWWGTSIPKGTGGTPEQQGRTWWGTRGEKWRSDGTGTPEGWLGKGRDSHSWRGPQTMNEPMGTGVGGDPQGFRG